MSTRGNQRTGYHPNVTRRRGGIGDTWWTGLGAAPVPSRDGDSGNNNDEERRRREEEERLRAEEEARIRAEEEARARAEEEARIKAEEDARIRAEEEARARAEEDRRQQEEANNRPSNDFRPDPTPSPGNDYNNVDIVRGNTIDYTNSAADGNINQSAYVDNSVRTTIGNDNVFGDNQSIGENYANTSINQVAQDFLADTMEGLNISQDVKVDNSVDTTVGDRNVFGDGLRLGNNYAVTDINQNGDFDLNLGDLRNTSRSEARGRSRDWLKTRS